MEKSLCLIIVEEHIPCGKQGWISMTSAFWRKTPSSGLTHLTGSCAEPAREKTKKLIVDDNILRRFDETKKTTQSCKQITYLH